MAKAKDVKTADESTKTNEEAAEAEAVKFEAKTYDEQEEDLRNRIHHIGDVHLRELLQDILTHQK